MSNESKNKQRIAYEFRQFIMTPENNPIEFLLNPSMREMIIQLYINDDLKTHPIVELVDGTDIPKYLSDELVEVNKKWPGAIFPGARYVVVKHLLERFKKGPDHA